MRRDMIAGIAQFLDAQFIDPAVAAVANVNPASITNGAPTAAATASPLADIMGLISHFATNNIAVDGVTFIMSAANALSLSFRTNLDGSPVFPGLSMDGGTYKGLTFVTSQAAGTNVIALQPALILYADDGGVTIDASREASLQMDSAPAVARGCDDRLRVAVADEHGRPARRALHHLAEGERERGQVPDGRGVSGAGRPRGGRPTTNRAARRSRPCGCSSTSCRSRRRSRCRRSRRPAAAAGGRSCASRTGAWQHNDALRLDLGPRQSDRLSLRVADRERRRQVPLLPRRAHAVRHLDRDDEPGVLAGPAAAEPLPDAAAVLRSVDDLPAAVRQRLRAGKSATRAAWSRRSTCSIRRRSSRWSRPTAASTTKCSSMISPAWSTIAVGRAGARTDSRSLELSVPSAVRRAAAVRVQRRGGASAARCRIRRRRFSPTARSRPGSSWCPARSATSSVERLKAQWSTAHGGINRGGTGILSQRHDLSTRSRRAPVDSQLTEQQKQAANTIAGVFGVPVSMVDFESAAAMREQRSVAAAIQLAVSADAHDRDHRRASTTASSCRPSTAPNSTSTI